MLIEIKNRYTDEVIFSLNVEDNSIKRTVEEAVKQGVSLCHANLYNADLSGADLSGANLNGAKLSDANLRFADLSGANLNDTKLSYAYLWCADLSGANLNGAKLSYANLRFADLKGADLSGIDISKAKLCYAKNVPDLPMACPKEGTFIGWKKIYVYKENYNGDFIVKLEIPEDAKRSSATGNKCRCSKAKVLEIRNIDTGECVDVITNINRPNSPCTYKFGEYVYPDGFDENRWNECSNGIHFFVTEQEARDY